MSTLLASLAAIDRAHPDARKILVGPDINYGRELLFALGRRLGGWAGWEAANLRGIAEELAFVSLGRTGRRAGTDIEIDALVNQALDLAISRRMVGPRFATLGDSLGFRHAVRDAVLEVRTAGVAAREVRDAAAVDSPARDLAQVIQLYEELLDSSSLVDPAGIFLLATQAFEEEAPLVLDGILLVAPTLRMVGLSGRLLGRLLEHGAQVLPDDPVEAVERPPRLVPFTPAATDDGPSAELDVFAAATPADEIREVLRRTLAEGLPWDAVEIVTTDEDAYGIALDAVTRHLGIGATMRNGVPLARTRIGRALERWFRWLTEDLSADVLREALEAGELAEAGHGVAPSSIARELRWLRIGWGRARYEAVLGALGDGGSSEAVIVRREDEGDEEFAGRKASRLRTRAALAGLLQRLLALAPRVPERSREEPVTASPSRLARATLRYLELVPPHGAAEESTLTRLRSRLEQLAEVKETGEVPFSRALAELREGLAEFRAWPGMASDQKPWSAAAGMVHLTGVPHAGTTGRPRKFLVGLDADRAAGPRVQEPILADTLRAALGGDALPTTAMRRAERGYLLARALASLRGRVTLSYAIAGEKGGRETGPAPIVLRAFRALAGKPALGYRDLRKALGAPACGVPTSATAALDGREVWLGALGEGPILLAAESTVREAFPGLSQGCQAGTERESETLTRYHGLVPLAAGALDPRQPGARPISPSALELLAGCPLAWFYRYGLGLRPPEDPEYDPEAWLGPMQRGALLHEVYESFTRDYVGRQPEIRHDAARDRMLELAEGVITRWRAEAPPPSEAVFLTESGELRQAALAFVELERRAIGNGTGGEWLAFELKFGYAAPATYELGGGGRIPVRGRIDRVDRLPDGRLRVIDYKTGSPLRFRPDPKQGRFQGGRTLQPAIYAAAAEALLGAEVARFEYRFPTHKGLNEVLGYGRSEMAAARDLIATLLRHAEQGSFIATTDANDCRFCDSRLICRVADGRYGAVNSPRAEWAAAKAGMLEAYGDMLQRRSPVGGQ